MNKFEYIQTKSILSKLKDAPDPYFGISYNMNLYRGCQHGCIYCDSRSDVYGLGDLSQIRIKQNAHQLLEQALHKRIPKATIGTGSMNDPYMPIEQTELQTHNALKIIAKYKYPVHIITKSSLVIRDTDIIRDIAKTYAAVSFTITTPNNTISKKIEPYANTSSERLKALSTISKQGIYCGVLIMPIMPYITNKPEHLKTLIKQCKDNGAHYVLFSPGLTIRKGQREYMYQQLARLYPGTETKYQHNFKFQYSCPCINQKQLWEIYRNTCQSLKLATRIKFYTPGLPQQQKLF